MMVTSNHQPSYANRAKQGNSASSSTSTTDVEKSADDVPVLNGSANATPNFWTARKEQMAAKVSATVSSSRSTTVAPSSSSSPTLVALPPLSSSTSLRGLNGVNLDDTSSWPDVSMAATPTKDRDRGKEKPSSSSPSSTPKKSEKTKWIPIPPSELQAAADASPSKQRGHRASSAQSSPKPSSRGRRLPTDEAHDTSNTRRRSPSHLATHAYTHPFNSPTRQPTSLPIMRPHQLPHTLTRQPPLTRQKRPVAPARSGPVAGYRDIDDLKIAEGRLVMFGSIGSGEERVLDMETRDAESTQGRGKSGAGGIAIGVKPDELPPNAKAPVREIVDLTDGAWIGGDSKWEFGTSSDRHFVSSNQNYVPVSNDYLPHAQHMFPHRPPPHLPYPPPESIDPLEYDTSRTYYRGGRRGRGRPGRRGMHHQHQHYVPPLHMPERFQMQDRYVGPGPEVYSPPGPAALPVPGPDGYYMMPYYYPPPPPGGPGVAPYPPPPSTTVPYPPPPPITAPMPPSAPIPMPVTATPFPIDPTRWYLLGQVEYYFSIQNLVSDFWLRKQMDTHGWIPISTIASFNRIRQLTANAYDTMLVKDVMALSALVEVYGDWVRLRDRQWVPFVLPGAGISVVGEPGEKIVASVDGTQVEDEEEDVVFVMGRDDNTQTS